VNSDTQPNLVEREGPERETASPLQLPKDAWPSVEYSQAPGDGRMPGLLSLFLGFTALSAVVMLLQGVFLSWMAIDMSGYREVPPMVIPAAAFAIFVGVCFIGVVVGVWKQKPWAKRAFAGVAIIVVVFTLISGSVFKAVWQGALALGWIGYLFSSERVKTYFKETE